MKIKKAVNTLRKVLNKDQNLYYGYQSNIAMAFVDEFNRNYDDKSIRCVANQAAKNFLNTFIKED